MERVETYGAGLRLVHEHVQALREDERHGRADTLAATAAFWLVSLDDALGSRSLDYVQRRPAVMLGLRFARNAVMHGFNVCARSTGLRFPIVYPIDFGPWVWNDRAHYLREWKPQTREPLLGRQVGAYGECLEGRLLAEPLGHAADWLEEWRAEVTS